MATVAPPEGFATRLAWWGLWCGVAAPVVYWSTVAAGAASLAGYSHVADPISSLTQSGRQGVLWIQVGFLLYNALMAAFAAAGLAIGRQSRVWAWVFSLVLLTAICGALMGPFAQDPIGSPATSTGTVHIALAAVTSLSTIAILILSAIGHWVERRWGRLTLDLLCVVLVVPFGVLTALAIPNHWNFMGLAERTTIMGFEIWVFAAALFMLRDWRKDHKSG